MVYDYSFDGKSLGALFACSVVLCVLLFFAGVMVGTGWGAKATPNADAQTAAQPVAAQPASAQPDAALPVAAQPASVALPTRVTSALPQEPVLYDDPARQEYAAQGYGQQGYGGAHAYNSRSYEQPGYVAQTPERQGYSPRGYAAQGAQAGAPTQAAERAVPPVSGRREADRLSALSIDPDPRLVEEADTRASEQPTGTPNYSVQVGAYLDEREARRLAGELENKGYTPTVFSGTDAEARVWYAVRIGAYASVKDAGHAANNFTRQEKLKAAVRPAGSL